MPDRRLRRHRAALRSERPLDLLVPEMSEITITPTLQTDATDLAAARAVGCAGDPAPFQQLEHHPASRIRSFPGHIRRTARRLSSRGNWRRSPRGRKIYNWMLVLRGGDGEAIGNIRFRPRVGRSEGQPRLLARGALLESGPDERSRLGGERFCLPHARHRELLRLQCGDQRGVAPGQAKDRRRTCRLHRACPSQRSDARGKMARDAGELAAPRSP